MKRNPSYWDYIQVERLLSLQGGVEEDESQLANEEVLFITVHQVHELWFKLVLRDLESARDLFALDSVPETSLARAARGLRRVERIFRFASEHFALLETMTTRDYLDFRDKLGTASGFQSGQFREVEILLGLADEDRVPFGAERDYRSFLREADGAQSPSLQRVEERRRHPHTLKSALEQWLYRTPIDGTTPDRPDDETRVRDFLERYLGALSEELDGALSQARASGLGDEAAARKAESYRQQVESARAFFLVEDRRLRRQRAAAIFLESYRELPLLSWPREILDVAIDMEQAYLIFRQRHARMVERMIGRRMGTGGSDGVAYLDDTALRYRVFPDFWQLRTYLLRKDAIPPLGHEDLYHFRAEPSP